MESILRDSEVALYWASLMAFYSVAAKIIYFYAPDKRNWLPVSLWGIAMILGFSGIAWIYNDIASAFPHWWSHCFPVLFFIFQFPD
ncbi:hypothetical protein HAT91_03094 [Dickeya solani]|nr:hypothetical protein HAT91_03094 [Dickeya solani]